MQLAIFIVLVTSCLTFLTRADNSGGNHAHTRPERSPVVLFDNAAHVVAAPTDEINSFPALKTTNQYDDKTSATFRHDFPEKQTSSDDEEDGEVSDPQRLKRFNEFVGKRNSEEDYQPASLETMRILASLSKIGDKQGLDQSNIKNQRNLKSLINKFYNNLRSDEASKRQYEFVGKRSYDFVGKKSYDFLGKRNPYNFIGKRYDFIGKRSPYDFVGKRSYDFVGKRGYDFVGKRSYDFVGKRSYDFLGKRSYDFVGKRAPYEFVGKRDQDSNAWENAGNISPATQKLSFNDNYSQDRSSLNSGETENVDKRYSEFLGKRKRSEEQDQSSQRNNNERLVALLQNNGFRKRLSRMLQNQRLAENYPEFIGK